MDNGDESKPVLHSREVQLSISLNFEDDQSNQVTGSAFQQQDSEMLFLEDVFKMNTNDPGCCSNEDIIEFIQDGTEKTSMESGGVNPLKIEDIVRDVMNYLPAKDVEVCRLVCQTWNKEACEVLRTKRTVVFMEADAVKVYNNAMRNTTGFPHAQFEFCIQDSTELVDEDLREFWNVFGPHIKTLELRQTHLFLRDFYEVVEQKVPNLEKLTLRHLPRHVTRSRNAPSDQRQILSVKELRLASLPTSGSNERLMTLLKSLPNLEVIEFLPINRATVQSRVSQTVVNILGNPEISLPRLKRVNLNLELNAEGLEAFTGKGYPLQRLHVTLSDGIKATSLKDLLMSLRPTLTELKIGFPNSYSNYQTFFSLNYSMKPEECVQLLTNLKSLNMTNFKGSINFVQKLSDLKNLCFTTSNLANSIPFGFQRMPSGFRQIQDHDLESLQVTSSTSLAETLTLEGISRCFPHLSCLHLHDVDDDGLGVIYRNLPYLSNVELSDANCTDQGLTGIPLEICNDMAETFAYFVAQADKYRRDLFIGSLQFLRKFSITASKISDATIALGLGDCKNLKELKIGSPLITDTGVIFITDKFFKDLDVLDISNCSEITELGKFYAGEKLVGKLIVDEDSCMMSNHLLKPPTPTDSGRAIIKTKELSKTAVRFQNPDVYFFEEYMSQPPPANRQRDVRIREALRRHAEFMRRLGELEIDEFWRLYQEELDQDLLRQDRLPQANLDGFRHQEIEGENVEGQGAEENNGNNQLVVLDEEEEEQQAPGVANVVDDDGEAQGDGALANRRPFFQLAELLALGLRPADVEYWLLNRLHWQQANGGAAAVDRVFDEIGIDVAFLAAIMNAIGDEG